jgi:hypothetical protein
MEKKKRLKLRSIFKKDNVMKKEKINLKRILKR